MKWGEDGRPTWPRLGVLHDKLPGLGLMAIVPPQSPKAPVTTMARSHVIQTPSSMLMRIVMLSAVAAAPPLMPQLLRQGPSKRSQKGEDSRPTIHNLFN
ncbi:hypothetical protein ABIC76_004162 [Ralstonia sp. 1138]